jgi:hypothetical protein
MKAIPPGEHLAVELKEMGMSAAEFSRQISVPTNRVTQILNGRRSITGKRAYQSRDANLERPTVYHRRHGATVGALFRHQRRVLAQPAKPV